MNYGVLTGHVAHEQGHWQHSGVLLENAQCNFLPEGFFFSFHSVYFLCCILPGRRPQFSG